MDNDQYKQTQDMLLRAAKIADDVNIDDFLSRISEAEATAPLFFPSQHKIALPELEAVKKLAQACIPLKQVLAEYPHLRKLILLLLISTGEIKVEPAGATKSDDVPPPKDVNK